MCANVYLTLGEWCGNISAVDARPQLDCTIWPIAQWFNFYFLPPSLRVVYTETINVAHSMFFSRFKHLDQKEREAKERALLEEAARKQQIATTQQQLAPVQTSDPQPQLQQVDLPSSQLDQKRQVGVL